MFIDPTQFLPGIGKAGAARLLEVVKSGLSEGLDELDRLADQQGEKLEPVDIMSIGPDVYVERWNAKFGKRAGVCAMAFGWVVIGLPVAAFFLMPLGEAFDSSQFAWQLGVRVVGVLVALWMLVAVLANLARAAFSLYLGYAPSSGVFPAFKALGRCVYGVGENAFYAVVDEGGKPDAVTVFYDAVGAVEVDASRASLPYPAITLRNREGRVLMQLPVPADLAGAYAELIRVRASPFRPPSR